MIDNSQITSLTVVELASAIGQGRISAETAVRAYLGRIEARESDVRAWVHLDADGAIAQAKVVDDLIRRGLPTPVLAGVPVGIKDIIDTSDMPTQCGSPAFKDRQPEHDAVCVERLRSAGAIILGKTVTTELATLTPNVTRNPHNLEHTPGGSSSGSAAAVADGMCPAALGTQTGGSVIRPASFCGIYGFKPTFGVIPRVGVLEQSQTLDTVGVYGNSVEDLALMMDVVGGFDGRDPACYRHMAGTHLRTVAGDYNIPPKVVFIRTPAWDSADADTRAAFEELVEALGDRAEEVNFDASMEIGLKAHKIINDVELAAHFGPILDRDPGAVSERLAQQIEGGRAISGRDYLDALQLKDKLYASIEEFFGSYSAIMTPAAPGPAPHGLGATGSPIFNAFWTMMGTPAVTLPLLEAENGLPMGVQLIGARRDDARLLRTARLFEQALMETADEA